MFVRVVLLGILTAAAICGAKPETSYPSEPFAKKMIKIGWSDFDAYYGTAVLFASRNERLYFITNHHVLPTDRTKWKLLHVQGYLTQLKSVPLRVEASAPGIDIAVVSIATPTTVTAKDVANLDELYFDESIEGASLHFGVLGVSGFSYDPRQTYRNRFWEDEAKSFSTLGATKTDVDLLPADFQLSVQKIALRSKTICPQIFIPGCYHLAIRTWGFSGGVLLGSTVTEKDNVKIAGIVSHFSPLAELSYFVPAPIALKVARSLLAGAQKANGFFYGDTDETDTFQYLTPISVLVLKGPLKGQTFFQISPSNQPGGGESSGGGGESSGGGGESSGGGGESSGGGGNTHGATGKQYSFMLDTGGNVAGLVNFDWLMKDVLIAPETWITQNNPMKALYAITPQFRGVDAVLNYQPGIYRKSPEPKKPNQPKVIYHRFGKAPLFNLQTFIRAYVANPNAELSQDFPKRPAPVFLKTPKDVCGVITGATVNPFYGAEERKRIGQSGNGFLLHRNENAVLTIHESYHLRYERDLPLDPVCARFSPFHGASLSRGTLIRQGGSVVVEAVNPRQGLFRLTFPDKFEQPGEDFYRYHGKMTLEWLAPSRVEKTGELYGIALLKMNPETNRFELKLASATNLPKDHILPEWKSLNAIVSPEKTLGLQAFYLPLDVLTAAPAILSLTELEREATENFAFEEKEFLRNAKLDLGKTNGIKPADNVRPTPKPALVDAPPKPDAAREESLIEGMANLTQLERKLGKAIELKENLSLSETVDRIERRVSRMEERLGIPVVAIDKKKTLGESSAALDKRITRVEKRAKILVELLQTKMTEKEKVAELDRRDPK